MDMVLHDVIWNILLLVKYLVPCCSLVVKNLSNLLSVVVQTIFFSSSYASESIFMGFFIYVFFTFFPIFFPVFINLDELYYGYWLYILLYSYDLDSTKEERDAIRTQNR